MNLTEFAKMANGLDKNKMPKSTATLCLVELFENEENEIVSNIKDMITLLTPEITIDFFVDGCDENAYIEVRARFGNPNSTELKFAWSLLEQFRNLNSLDNVPIDMDVIIESDTKIELMILPRETIETDPVFLELAFPINFNLCSSQPGRVADTLNMFFNANSCIFHENEYVDMEEVEAEAEQYIQEVEYEYQTIQKNLIEEARKQEESLKAEVDLTSQPINKPETVHRIRLGGNRYEDKEDNT